MLLMYCLTSIMLNNSKAEKRRQTGAVLFPRDVLDEILDLIESVSEGFPTYS